MSTNWIKATVAVMLAASLVGCGGGSDGASSDSSILSSDKTVLAVDSSGVSSIDAAVLSATLTILPLESLSTAETDSLTLMRQEETMAHDVYAISATLYPQLIFSNIAAAEDTHAAAVKTLLDRYQLPDPLSGQPTGTFPDATIQSLYTQFVNTSATNLVAALTIGVQIEELDLHDLALQLTLVDNADIQMVYSNLMKGSRNHLRAFMKVLTQQGGTYTPVYLTQVEFDAIVNSPIESGR